MKMNDEDQKRLAALMEEMFGERLVDPEQHPQIFAYQVRLAKYEMNLKAGKSDPKQD
jgi:hypothetical protein